MPPSPSQSLTAGRVGGQWASGHKGRRRSVQTLHETEDCAASGLHKGRSLHHVAALQVARPERQELGPCAPHAYHNRLAQALCQALKPLSLRVQVHTPSNGFGKENESGTRAPGRRRGERRDRGADSRWDPIPRYKHGALPDRMLGVCFAYAHSLNHALTHQRRCPAPLPAHHCCF